MLSASTTFLSTFIFCIVLRKGGFVKYSSYVTNDEFSSPFMEQWTLDARVHVCVKGCQQALLNTEGKYQSPLLLVCNSG